MSEYDLNEIDAMIREAGADLPLGTEPAHNAEEDLRELYAVVGELDSFFAQN
mgnify:CR=1 FL=1